MMGGPVFVPRKLLVDPTEVGVYHCISRCVRRAFLCGNDRLTGKNFDHRKEWIQDRIEFLAGQFGVDVLGFSVMSNHIHVVLRNRPDVLRDWSDEEVARRWWNLFPLRRDDEGNPAEPLEWELSMVTGNPERLAEVRRRLSSIPWFMRCLAEPIARWANREDGCTGRFWEGRYKCQPILDESALAACLAYVDLNPIRAGIAAMPETSLFTSVYERIGAMRDMPKDSAIQVVGLDGGGNCPAESAKAANAAGDAGRARADWLSPFELSAEEARKAVPPGRASNSGCLPMRFTEYLALLDWTGRQVREDKRGAIPPELAPILERLQMSGEGWLHLVQGFSRMFRRAAGRPTSLRQHADKWGRRRMSGIAHSRSVFG